MEAVERIVVPTLTLAAPVNHVLQHAISDDVPGLESTEQQPTLNTFRENHILRLGEVRCDKNNGVVKTTNLVVTNANFNAHYGDPDSYDDANKVNTFTYESRTGAVTCRSGGAYIGDGLRVGGAACAPIFVNDQPNPENTNERIRTYVPGMNLPYIIKVFTLNINEQTSIVDNVQPLGNHFKSVVDIPPDIYFLCRRNDALRPNIAVLINPIDNFGVAFHSTPVGVEDYQFIVRATLMGAYKVILFAERTDAIANGVKYGETFNSNRYFPIGGADPNP